MRRTNPSDASDRVGKRKRRPRGLRVVLLLLLCAAVALAGWPYWVYIQIERYAAQDQAARADAIGVLGAAEYDGHPSPILRARLEHARSLYARGIAPLIITMGGGGGDEFSEGAVGRDYLMGAGVPENAIIAETESHNTEEAARRIAVIARANGLHKMVIVSDSSHLFRIHETFAAQGIEVLTSPRPRVDSEENPQTASRIAHEIFAYTLWRMHLH